MLSAQDLHGIVGMMPAFATPESADISATATIDVDNLKAGVDRIIGDGLDIIATTGSFGECHTLLDDELETLARATVEAVNHRVPLFIGCSTVNPRDAVKKMRMIQDAGADGVLVAVPFYFPSSVDNAVRFYHDIAELFPRLGVMIYHNPLIHHVALPSDAFRRIIQSPNIVAMKDTSRDNLGTMQLMEIVRDKIAVFPAVRDYAAYARYGVSGCWSIEAWMGPWPLLRLRDAIDAGDDATAQRITLELQGNRSSGGGPVDLTWRETSIKIAMEYAGYCKPGPLRSPFLEIPPAVDERAKRSAQFWTELSARYRPQVEAPVTA
jgi:dihydrodipicolinate synthase/N-acetylneuraminate lyase